MKLLAKLLLVAACILSFTSSSMAQESPQKMDPRVALVICSSSQEPAQIIEACTLVLKTPFLPEDLRQAVQEARGVAFVSLGNFHEGLVDLAYARTPRELSMRAEAYLRIEAYEDAIADLDEVLRIAPDYTANTFNARAWAYFKIGKSEKGLPDANRAIELKPDFAEAYDTRAHIYEHMSRHHPALREDPNDTYDKSGRLTTEEYRARAIADYRKALELRPGLRESVYGLGRMGFPE
jgi:tetratricopeptide (TPR) repeat protein